MGWGLLGGLGAEAQLSGATVYLTAGAEMSPGSSPVSCQVEAEAWYQGRAGLGSKMAGGGRGVLGHGERDRDTLPPKPISYPFLSLTISHRIPHLGNKVWNGESGGFSELSPHSQGWLGVGHDTVLADMGAAFGIPRNAGRRPGQLPTQGQQGRQFMD